MSAACVVESGEKCGRGWRREGEQRALDAASEWWPRRRSGAHTLGRSPSRRPTREALPVTLPALSIARVFGDNYLGRTTRIVRVRIHIPTWSPARRSVIGGQIIAQARGGVCVLATGTPGPMSIDDPAFVVDVMDEHEARIRIDYTKNGGRGRPG